MSNHQQQQTTANPLHAAQNQPLIGGGGGSSTPNPIAAPAANTMMIPNAKMDTAAPTTTTVPTVNNSHLNATAGGNSGGNGGVPAVPMNSPMASAAAAASVGPSGVGGGPKEEYEEIREQDRYLPIANIARIMKNTLPDNAKIAKDSKETVQECVSEFISFITSEASDKCMQEKRKTINGDDLLWAMSTLGFDKYVEPLKVYLTKYREAIRGDKPEGKGSKGGVHTGSGRPSTNNAVVGSSIGLPADYAGLPPSSLRC